MLARTYPSVRLRFVYLQYILVRDITYGILQDDNVTVRTWHPAQETEEPPVRAGIMPHHEVLLRLDAMDLDRGVFVR